MSKEVRVNNEKKLPDIKLGIHQELEDRGFGHLNKIFARGLYVRMYITTIGTSAKTRRVRVQVVPENTELWPSSPSEKPKGLRRWWKNESGHSDVHELLSRYCKQSLDQEQQFTVNGLGELIPRSQKALKKI